MQTLLKKMQYLPVQLMCQIGYLIFLAGFYPLTLPAQAPENPRFERITTNDGLPSKYVHYITQDEQGFIWIGSAFGLSRFDGYQLKNYKYDPQDSTGINNVSVILPDEGKGLWIGTYIAGLKYLDLQTGRFTHYSHDEENPRSLSNNLVNTVYKDDQGRLWVATDAGGLNLFDPDTGEFSHYSSRSEPGAPDLLSIWALLEDDQERLWAGGPQGLFLFDRSTGKFTEKLPTSIQLEDGTRSDASLVRNITSLSGDNDGVIWIGAQGNGVIRWNTVTGSAQRYWSLSAETPAGKVSTVSDIVSAGPQAKWVRSGEGLFYFDVDRERFTAYRHDPGAPNSLSANQLHSPYTNIFIDREQNLWTGSLLDMSILVRRYQDFYTYQHEGDNPNSISNNAVSEVFEDHLGYLWIATETGLDRLDQATGQFTHYRHQADNPNSLAADRVTVVYEDSDQNLWVCTADHIHLFNRETGQFKRYLLPVEPNQPCWPSQLLEDRQGRIWMGSDHGLYRFYPAEKQFVRYLFHDEHNDTTKLQRLRDYNPIMDEFTIDKFGQLWIPYRFKGLTRFNPETGKFERFLHDPENPNSISDNFLLGVFQDKQGDILVPTSVGMDRLTLEPGQDPPFTVQRKIVASNVNNLLEDDRGNLWLGSYDGLLKYYPDKDSIRAYGLEEGLVSLKFRNSAFRSPRTGTFFFLTEAGVLRFHPDSIQDNPVEPPVYITSLSYYDSQDPGEQAVEISNITYREALKLPHHQNTLFLEFAALSYNKTDKNEYAYKLEGGNEGWVSLGTERKLTLVDLRPGNYTLRIKGSNGDGIWNEAGTAMKLTILPPWWWSLPAKVSYLLLLLGLLYAFYRFQLNRQLAQAETQRLKELDEVKTRLYGNITHEFRTPLTIILGMADKIDAEPKTWLSKGLTMIRRNGQNLLRLVNQMLDLSKLESGKLPLRMVQADVIPYLRYIMESFHSYAEMKNIQLHFHATTDALVMDYDPDQLLNITSNLLSNAVKFTAAGGHIYITVGEEQKEQEAMLLLSVRDTGVGIPKSKLPHIFDRFYQVDDSATRKGEGTGIGLALTKQLVTLMEGEITVKSQVDKGTEFKIFLPIRREASVETDFDQGKIEKAGALFSPVEPAESRALAQASNGLSEKPVAMIVEDNEDVVRYLVSCLEESYQLEVAYNGAEGINRALELVPDIIVSDVMMPEKDGIELCDTLKNDMRTSHIPIVLLTAKADIQSRIEGLRTGADAYLAKPFNEEELKVRLAQLLALRKKLWARYADGSRLPENDTAEQDSESALEDTFIRQVREVIEAHLDDYDLDVSKLCRKLGISRTPLHNKLKALTGMSTTEFVRHIRLHKAKDLLLRTDLNINEVAYETGFRNHNYFTKTFGDTFDMSPSQWREGHRKQG